MDCSMPGFRVHHQLWKLTRANVNRVNDAIQPSHPLSSPSLPTFNLSQHWGLFKWISSLHQVAKILEFQLHSFRIDWLDLLAIQGTLKSLLQHHSSKASILRRSTFFIVQLSHPYMTIGKIIALIRWTFVGKVMSLLSVASINLPLRLSKCYPWVYIAMVWGHLSLVQWNWSKV